MFTRVHRSKQFLSPLLKSNRSTLPLFSTASYSTEKEKEVPELRKILRKFYLKVHPDLFTDFPKEKVNNQNSLKELTAFTDQWCKNTAQSVHKPKTKKTIQFYLKKQKEEKKPETESDSIDPVVSQPKEEPSDGLTTFSMTLISNGSFSEIQSQYVNLFARVSIKRITLKKNPRRKYKSNNLRRFRHN